MTIAEAVDRVRDDIEKCPTAGFLWSNTREGMAFVDADGVIRDVNDAFVHMLGYSHRELSGKHFADITVHSDIEADRIEFREMVEGRKQSYEMVKSYRSKARRIVTCRLRVIPFESGVLFCGQILPVDTLSLDQLPPEDEQRIMSMLVGRWVLEHWKQVIAIVAAIGGVTNLDRILSIFQ